MDGNILFARLMVCASLERCLSIRCMYDVCNMSLSTRDMQTIKHRLCLWTLFSFIGKLPDL